MAKRRLDLYLVEEGLCPSREMAKSLIMAGKVFVNNQRSDKAGDSVGEKDTVEVRGETLKYVSRGGLKLEKAMASFPISLEGKVCMDIGASTGGFTDCMLQNGAGKVFAVDVGYGQLAWKLRCDERVVNMERTNIRYVTEEQIGTKLDFVSIDVAFISLKLVLPVAYNLMAEGAEMVALIKPQFEAGRENVGKKGVVRDINVHKDVVKTVVQFTQDMGFSIKGLDFSPIRGPEGNIEYLMYVSKEKSEAADFSDQIDAMVEKSHIEAK
ncbi:MAG: TlyA family RNA methyltransferase [Clostridia bacterium]|nr:TlyA family RNA methyltransferase [Clostridia bacterium]